MEILHTAIPDVWLLKPKVFGDNRGYFFESFRESWFRDKGLDLQFVQDNQSASVKNVLRGLHYQVCRPQGKLVRVVSGEVYDVAVDLRQGSPTFGKYVGEYLSADNKHLLWIPPGFAHGFCVISEYAELHYKCTDYYCPEYDRSLLWNDTNINIQWPLNHERPILSEKDSKAKQLSEAELF